MESLSAGTFVGSGSFRCQRCGYALTLEGSDVLTACPSCGGEQFLRASLFSTERISKQGQTTETTEATLVEPAAPGLAERLDRRAGSSSTPASTSSTRRARSCTRSRSRESGRASVAAWQPTCASTTRPSRGATR